MAFCCLTNLLVQDPSIRCIQHLNNFDLLPPLDNSNKRFPVVNTSSLGPHSTLLSVNLNSRLFHFWLKSCKQLLSHEDSDFIDNSLPTIPFKVANTNIQWVIFPLIDLCFCSLRHFIAGMQTFGNLGTSVIFESYLCRYFLSQKVYNLICLINTILKQLHCTGI